MVLAETVTYNIASACTYKTTTGKTEEAKKLITSSNKQEQTTDKNHNNKPKEQCIYMATKVVVIRCTYVKHTNEHRLYSFVEI